MKKRIAVLASGWGSNFQAVIDAIRAPPATRRGAGGGLDRGFVVAAVALAYAAAADRSVVRAAGLAREGSPGRSAAFAVLGVALGIAGAAGYRHLCDWEPWPSSLHGFAGVAAAMGAVEELVYRGVLYSRLRPHGRALAIGGTAALHAIYKGALFAWPPGDHVAELTIGTFAAGLVLGALREAAGDVRGALAGHAAFDVVTYAEQVEAPWWTLELCFELGRSPWMLRALEAIRGQRGLRGAGGNPSLSERAWRWRSGRVSAQRETREDGAASAVRTGPWRRDDVPSRRVDPCNSGPRR